MLGILVSPSLAADDDEDDDNDDSDDDDDNKAGKWFLWQLVVARLQGLNQYFDYETWR